MYIHDMEINTAKIDNHFNKVVLVENSLYENSTSFFVITQKPVINHPLLVVTRSQGLEGTVSVYKAKNRRWPFNGLSFFVHAESPRYYSNDKKFAQTK